MKERFETFTVLINRISRNIRKIKNMELEEYHLKSIHGSCIYYLYTTQNMTATELCECCEEDKATISRALDYLEKNGYLTCKSPNEKRYKIPLILTEKGKEAGKKITDKIENVLQEMNDGLTEEEREAFYRSLSVISKSLNEVAEKYQRKEEAE